MLMLHKNRFLRLLADWTLCRKVLNVRQLLNSSQNFLMKLTTMTTKQRLLLKTLPKESQLELLKELNVQKQKGWTSSPSKSDSSLLPSE